MSVKSRVRIFEYKANAVSMEPTGMILEKPYEKSRRQDHSWHGVSGQFKITRVTILELKGSLRRIAL
jgi:hypothetical protein